MSHAVGAFALAALLAALALLGATASARAAGCAHAHDTWADATLDQLEGSVVCLVNKKRHSLARKRLDRNGHLDRAAASHTRTMVEEDCFDHQCPGEPSLARRVRMSGYLRGADRWHFGESFGCALTPKGMVNAWLQVRFHRRNLLKREYRDIGVGAGRGAPTECSADPAVTTYTVVVAWRKP